MLDEDELMAPKLGNDYKQYTTGVEEEYTGLEYLDYDED